MKLRFALRSMTLLLALCTAALASTTWYVDGVHGSDNNNCKSPQAACKTIGHAISLASSGDSIQVAPATYTENLTINLDLKIRGSGARTTIIDGGGAGKVVAVGTIRLGAPRVTLSKLTIRNGHDQVGGGISNTGVLTIVASAISGNVAQCIAKCITAARGGGIFNSGTLIVNDSTLRENSADTQPCNTACLAQGGGIFNSGTLTVNNSTLRENSADTQPCKIECGAQGGGIFNSGTLTVNNSTLFGNSVSSHFFSFLGGGIYNSNGTQLTVSNSTLSGNHAFAGGGIENRGTATIQNTIIADNVSNNCLGTMTSRGYNLSSDGSCNFNGSGDLNKTDPRLGPLQNNGGPTHTQSLLQGSPAIDAGNPNGCTDGDGHLLKTDQRGAPRHDKEDTGGCDMGAYERQKD
jgi:hypothetical protein